MALATLRRKNVIDSRVFYESEPRQMRRLTRLNGMPRATARDTSHPRRTDYDRSGRLQPERAKIPGRADCSDLRASLPRFPVSSGDGSLHLHFSSDMDDHGSHSQRNSALPHATCEGANLYRILGILVAEDCIKHAVGIAYRLSSGPPDFGFLESGYRNLPTFPFVSARITAPS